jgi:hypothetical protein
MPESELLSIGSSHEEDHAPSLANAKEVLFGLSLPPVLSPRFVLSLDRSQTSSVTLANIQGMGSETSARRQALLTEDFDGFLDFSRRMLTIVIHNSQFAVRPIIWRCTEHAGDCLVKLPGSK